MISLDLWAEVWSVSPEALKQLRRLMGVHAEVTVRSDLPAHSEAAVQQQIRLAAPKQGVTLWRNNNGAAQDSTGRVIRYGLGNDSKKMNACIKSSDLIGITSKVINPADIGRTLGVFTCIETKRSNWIYKGTDAEKAQLKWLDLVISLGGYAKFSTGTEES